MHRLSLTHQQTSFPVASVSSVKQRGLRRTQLEAQPFSNVYLKPRAPQYQPAGKRLLRGAADGTPVIPFLGRALQVTGRKAPSAGLQCARRAPGAGHSRTPAAKHPAPEKIPPSPRGRRWGGRSGARWPRDVVQSRADAGGFCPTGGWSPPPPLGQGRQREGAGPWTWSNGYARRGGRGGAGRAAQGRAAEAPMSARRVRGRLVRETPPRGWWLM